MTLNRMFKPSLLLVLTLVLCFAMAGTAAAEPASPYPNGAKTAPPPESDMHPEPIFVHDFTPAPGDFGTYKFEPWHKYLDSGNVSITDRGNGKVGFSGTTFATQKVSTVALKLTLQMWTGKEWIDLKEIEFKDSNDITVYGSDTRDCLTGYYYRVLGYHWVIQGTDFERGYTTGNSILVL
ncbi:Uncharacterised protein [Chlamydia abortus]|uniref:Uncharacterized protein n=1 Tax=Paenibacillus residui TaxID=629724 RepID=A0ABW3DIP8_9BACL|nr:Uncharacterised protein [Chlamydia abortus]